MNIRLSGLQRYILNACFQGQGTAKRSSGRISREPLHGFYDAKEYTRKEIVNMVTKALERLIDRGLLTGIGVRTPKKWYIKEVRLTPAGRRIAKKLQGEQLRLPLQGLRIKQDKD